MKDNALRDVLIESGTIKFDNREGITVLRPVFLEDKISAIAEYLGVKFQYAPERIFAKKKDAPQEIKEDSALRTTQAAQNFCLSLDEVLSIINRGEWAQAESMLRELRQKLRASA